jgi:hypothetical protein
MSQTIYGFIICAIGLLIIVYRSGLAKVTRSIARRTYRTGFTRELEYDD